ncbi:MAG: hypothetical protein ACRDJC_15990 [Thermomicrobiales bacterium]
MHRRMSSLLVLAVSLVVATGTWPPATTQESTLTDPAASAITKEIMFRHTFPRDALPPAPARAVFYRLTLPPGANLPVLVGPFCGCPGETLLPGVGVEVVEVGAYTLRLGAQLEVRRATPGGVQPTVEQIPADSDATLGPGDVAVYPDYAATGEIRSGDDDPAVVVGLAIVSETKSGTPAPALPSGVIADELSRAIPSDLEKLPPGPVTVTLRRVTLPPGAAPAPYELPGLQAIDVQAGQIGIAYTLPGETTPSRPATVYHAGQTAPFLPLQVGTKIAMTNSGDEPAELLVLAVAPAGAYA